MTPEIEKKRIEDFDEKCVTQRLRYEPDTGFLIWLPRGIKNWDSRWAGTKAGTVHQYNKCNKAYIKVIFDNKHSKLAHQLAFYLMTGRWAKFIDHINGNGCDNRWVNLRESSHKENNRNRRLSDKSKTGLHGVYIRGSRYRVTARISGRSKSLGTFQSIFEAACARKSFEWNNGFSAGHGEKRPSYGISEIATGLGLRIKE